MNNKDRNSLVSMFGDSLFDIGHQQNTTCYEYIGKVDKKFNEIINTFEDDNLYGYVFKGINKGSFGKVLNHGITYRKGGGAYSPYTKYTRKSVELDFGDKIRTIGYGKVVFIKGQVKPLTYSRDIENAALRVNGANAPRDILNNKVTLGCYVAVSSGSGFYIGKVIEYNSNGYIYITYEDSKTCPKKPSRQLKTMKGLPYDTDVYVSEDNWSAKILVLDDNIKKNLFNYKILKGK